MGRGGARSGAGRKSKAEEMGLKELLDSCVSKADRKKLFLEMKRQAIEEGNLDANKTLLAYLYGKPTERREVEVRGVADLVLRWGDEAGDEDGTG